MSGGTDGDGACGGEVGSKDEKPTSCGTIFLISPIGAGNSDDREHADLVHEMLLKPAASELHTARCKHRKCGGLEVRRADHKPSVGNVMTEVAELIASADVIVAILTGVRADEMNPNVMYELGVAHAAARQTVLLHREGTTRGLPFDIRHMRATNYALKPSRQKDQIAEIRHAIQQALEKEQQTRTFARDYGTPIHAFDIDGIEPMGVQYRKLPYNKNLLKEIDKETREPKQWLGNDGKPRDLGPSQIIPQQAFDKFLNIKDLEIVEMILRSNERILLIDPFPEFFVNELRSVLKPGNERSNARKIEALEMAASKGVRINLLITDPQHQALMEMMPGIGQDRLGDHVEALTLWEKLAQLPQFVQTKLKESATAEQVPAVSVYRINDRILPVRVIANEREAILLPRFTAIKLSGQNPCLRISCMMKLHDEIFFEADSAIKNAGRAGSSSDAVASTIDVMELSKIINNAKSYIFWHNPPFKAPQSGLPTEATDGDSELSWHFLNLLTARSIVESRSVSVSVSVHVSECIPDDAIAGSGEIRERLSTLASAWSRFINVAHDFHNANIRFADVTAPVRLESIIATENCALFIPLAQQFKSDGALRAIRIEGNTPQHAALVAELRELSSPNSPLILDRGARVAVPGRQAGE